MSDKEKNINYTARDIEAYLAGNLSPQQMHAMEKAALDDPFLAEAMEGYEAVKGKEWNNQLVVLREEIANKGTIAKVIPLHKSKNNWWKVAAAIFIIGSGAILTFIFTDDKKEENGNTQIAQTIPVVKDSFIQLVIPVSPSVTESLNATASATAEQKQNIPGSIAKPEDFAKRTDVDIIPEPGAPQLKAVNRVSAAGTNSADKIIVPASPANNLPETNNGEFVTDNTNEKSKPAAKQNNVEILQDRQQNQGLANVKKEVVLNNFFTAQVVGSDNTPLPFTNISIKKENFGTYADAKGIVRLVSTDSILQVEVKSVGYQAKTYVLRNNQP
jgi:hypothetical protein